MLEYALEEMRNLGHNYIGTEHLLLGLIRENDSEAAQVMINMGIDLDLVRNAFQLRMFLELEAAALFTINATDDMIGNIPPAETTAVWFPTCRYALANGLGRPGRAESWGLNMVDALKLGQ